VLEFAVGCLQPLILLALVLELDFSFQEGMGQLFVIAPQMTVLLLCLSVSLKQPTMVLLDEVELLQQGQFRLVGLEGAANQVLRLTEVIDVIIESHHETIADRRLLLEEERLLALLGGFLVILKIEFLVLGVDVGLS
jgi:hypothetical protein